MKAGPGTQVTTEVERKFDVDAGFVLPPLDGVAGVAAVADPRELDLDATYFDTPDLRLLGRRMTLRRRTGGDDAGWHLKRPREDGERDEVRHPLGGSRRRVPPAVREAVEAALTGHEPAAADAELVPVVRLRTRRVVTLLRDADGKALVEVADDAVTATLPGADGRPGEVRRWREVEVELIGGDQELLTRVGERLVGAGARPSASRSKLGRALDGRGASGPDRGGRSGDRADDRAADRADDRASERAGDRAADRADDRPADRADDRSAARPSDRAGGRAASPDAVPNPAATGRRARRAARAGRAGAVVTAHLSYLVAVLQACDPQVRDGADDAVHRMRVATRRLRSCLVGFRPLFDPAVTEPLRAELAWLGGVLGAARDAEVVAARLLDDLDRQPPALVPGPIRERVAGTLRQRQESAREQLVQALDSGRYVALRDQLDALIDAPPLTEAAQDRPARVLLPLVERSRRRVERLVAAVDDAVDPVGRDRALHEVRKAAKRARYTAEAVQDRWGTPARDFAAAMTAVQDALGEHQDSVVIRAELLRLSDEAQRAGEPTFGYGRLHAWEEQQGLLTEAAFTRCWRRACRRSLRAWLR